MRIIVDDDRGLAHEVVDAHRVYITVGDRKFTIRANDRRDHPEAIIVDTGLKNLIVTPGASNYIRVRQED